MVPFLGGDGAGRRRRRARRRRIDSSAVQSSSAGVESTPPLFNRASRHRPAREAGACRAQACPSHVGCCRRRRCACSPSHALLGRRVGHIHRREARRREWGPCSRAGGCDRELLGRRGGTRRGGPAARERGGGGTGGGGGDGGENEETREKGRKRKRGKEKKKKKRKRENIIGMQYLLETAPNALPLLHYSSEANIYLPLKNA